jgi:hypothetical protein
MHAVLMVECCLDRLLAEKTTWHCCKKASTAHQKCSSCCCLHAVLLVPSQSATLEDAPSREDYLALLQESEYGAW